MAKDEKKDRKKELTSEEYRQEAGEHMDTLRKEWKMFGKTGIFVVAAVIAVIIISIAWFANNRSVTGSGMAIQSAGSEFELAAKGTPSDANAGRWDKTVLGDEYDLGNSDTIEGFSSTGGSKNSISWVITGESNLNNENQNGAGINPGSSGTLTFYIIAHKAGTLTVPLEMTLTGLKENKTVDNKKTYEPVEPDVQNLLEGHLLLFAGYNTDTKSYSNWISKDADDGWSIPLKKDESDESSYGTLSYTNGGLTWSAEVEKDKAYPVTIHWIWPEILGEYLYPSTAAVGGRPVLFPKVKEVDSLPSNLFSKMAAKEADTVSNRYFKWTSNSVTDFSSAVGENYANLIGIRNSTSLTTAYWNLCRYYDDADQYLGENVDYVKLRLDAQ